MKKTVLLSILALLIKMSFSQINYFDQKPPGNSSVIFAPGIVSQPDRNERGLTISPDGKEAFFQIIYGNWDSSETKYYVLVNNKWIEKPVPDSLKGYILGEPTYSPDGKRIYFSYNPYSQIWQNELFYIEKRDSKWSKPVKLPPNVNFVRGLWHPSVTRNGNLYFAYNGNLYVCCKNQTGYNAAELLPRTLNTSNTKGVWDPWVDPDERFMVFKSDRQGGYGDHDIYISFMKNGQWTNMKNLGSRINTSNAEDASDITPDGEFLTFTKIVNGEKDIYWMSCTTLFDSLKNSNYSPYVNNFIPNIKDTVGRYFSYTIPDSIFFDDDGTETLTLSAELNDGNLLPDSLVFIPETNTICGTIKNAGDYDFKITAADDDGEKTSDVFRLTVVQNTNIDDHGFDSDHFLIYPVPSKNTIYIRDNNWAARVISYCIVDIKGKVVKKDKLITNAIDISDLLRGIYILQLSTLNTTVFQKILVE